MGTIWSDWKSSCIFYECPINSKPLVVENGVNCECNDGFYKVDKQCEIKPVCPKYSEFNTLKRKCICVKEGFTMINEVCVNDCS